MGWTSITATYLIVWWLVLFTTLPFGVKVSETVEEGNEPGAPEKPLLWIKAGVTTVLAAVITAAIWALIEYQVIDFRAR